MNTLIRRITLGIIGFALVALPFITQAQSTPTSPSPCTTGFGLNVAADRSVFNPNAGELVTFSGRACQQIDNLSLFVEGQGYRELLRTWSGPTTAGVVRSQPWNGFQLNGSNFPAGTYRFIFQAGGIEMGSGTVEIRYSGTTPPGGSGFFIEGGCNNSPTTPLEGQPMTINYRLGKNVNSFRLSVRSLNGGFNQTVDSSSSFRSVGNYSATWNGAGSTAGNYEYVFEASGEQPVTCRFYVDRSGSNPNINTPRFVGSCTVTPTNINQNDVVRVRYTVDRNANVEVRVQPSGTFVQNQTVNGNQQYEATWTATSAPGNYSFQITARNPNNFNDFDTCTTLFTIQGGQNQSGMSVTNVRTDRTSFDTTIQNSITLSYTINQEAYVTVDLIRLDGTFVTNLITRERRFAGSNSESWYGRYGSSSTLVPSDLYQFRVQAWSVFNNAYDSKESNSFSFNRGGGGGGSSMDVYSVSVSPTVYYPENNRALTIYFSLNQSAYVTVSVRNVNGSYNQTIVSNQYYSGSGSYTEQWYGYDSALFGFGYAPEGSYNVTVSARSANNNASDQEYASFSVVRGGGGGGTGNFYINDQGASPNPFDNTRQTTSIRFSVSRSPSSTPRVRIQRGSTFIRELSVFNQGSNNYSAQWDGRDSSGRLVARDSYTYIIEANDFGNTIQRSGTVRVDTGFGGGTGGTGDCGNFRDVSRSHYLCPAIDFVRSRGIFVGYPDGTLGLDRVIQRAELLAVIQKAFRYSLDHYDPSFDRNLGYRDLNEAFGQWFMPYVKTFSRLGIMVGYPDGRMRPERTMTTAELYVVFLKAALRAPGAITHFTLPGTPTTHEPFIDTPVRPDTQWFLRYAEFAKINDLVRTERFYPARGITRGQVIQLVYDTYRKGLIDYR